MPSDSERLDLLEVHAQKAERNINDVYGIVTNLSKQFENQASKIDQLVEIVTTQRAQPRFNPRDALDSIKSVIAVLMMLLVPAAGALIWMITIVTSASDAKQNADIAHNRELMSLQVRILRRDVDLVREIRRLSRKADKL